MSFGAFFEQTIVPLLSRISPELCTKVLYRVRFKKKLDFNNPVTLNEKVLWLRFNTYKNNPTIKRCADKMAVRSYIEEQGFGDLLINLIAAYDDPNLIEWDKLPNSFAIKMNIGSGMNIIVKDKNKIDISKTQDIISGWFDTEFWTKRAELQYKDVKPYVLFEQNMSANDGTLPEDYKFYCMNGKSLYVMLCVDRVIGKLPKFFYFDRNWNMMPYTKDALAYPDFVVQKPAKIEEAFEIAEALSKPFPFVRVDLYIVDNKIYFGELTFTPSAGLDVGRLPKTDKILGEQLTLPEKTKVGG